jgi:hypothetical protein
VLFPIEYIAATVPERKASKAIQVRCMAGKNTLQIIEEMKCDEKQSLPR